MIKLVTLLIIPVFLMCCKTQIREAKQVDNIVVKISDVGLIDFNSKSLPVLVCGQNSEQSLIFGEWNSDNKLSFSLQNTGVVQDDKICFIDIYSNQIDGLTLRYDNVKFIDGKEYRLVFQSNELPLKSINSVVFKKGFDKKKTNVLLYTITFRGELDSLKTTLDIFCKETKNIRLTKKENNLYQASVFEEHIVVKSSQLSNCILKNNSNELTIKLSDVKSSLSIINKKQVEIELGPQYTGRLADNDGKLTRAPSWLIGKQFTHKATDGCEYTLGFALDGESYSYQRVVVEGCMLPSYVENGASVSYYIKHADIAQTLSQDRVLTVFDSGFEVTYSIVEKKSSGIFRLGGYVTRPQYLNSISVGLSYELKN